MYFCFLSLFLMQPTTEIFESRNQPQKKLDPRNTYEKKFHTLEIITRKIFWTHKISTRKNFGPTKYPRKRNFTSTKYPQEKYLDAQNTHEKKFWIYEVSTRENFRPTKYSRRHYRTMTLNPRDPGWQGTHQTQHTLHNLTYLSGLHLFLFL